ncbi:MAG: Crp/Fnr family transcriptional regulator [Gammaproteobacteria bacterium]
MCLTTVKGQSLSGVKLFAGLDLEARDAIARLCRGAEFEEGEVLVGHKDTDRDVFFILSGEVTISAMSVNGKRVAYHDKQAGDMVGELAAIDGQPRSALVKAKTNCQTAYVSQHDFMRIMADYPDVSVRAMQYLAGQIRNLSARVFEFGALCVNDRIHVELLRYAMTADTRDTCPVIAPAPTHADIACRVSTHREAVTRELNRLAREGVLQKEKDAIVVSDLSRLEQMVSNSLGDVPRMH